MKKNFFEGTLAAASKDAPESKNGFYGPLLSRRLSTSSGFPQKNFAHLHNPQETLNSQAVSPASHQKSKIETLSGATLDYWVAAAVGIDQHQIKIQVAQRSDKEICVLYGISRYAPSEDWSAAGPLIDKYAITLTKSMSGSGWIARQEENNISGDYAYGATPLMAVCRAIVLSRFGAEVPEASQ